MGKQILYNKNINIFWQKRIVGKTYSKIVSLDDIFKCTFNKYSL